MWSYLDSPTALLAREMGAVPKFPPQHPRRVMLPVPKKLALAAWGKLDKRQTEDDSAAWELCAVPKFSPHHPRRVMLPVPKKLALAAWRDKEKRRADDDSAACTCKRSRWTDSLTDLDKILLGME